MKNFKKLIKEALTPDFLTEYNQTQGREEYRDIYFEVLYSPEDGYSIESERYEIVNPNAYFSTYAEAVEHAELEIDGYLGEWEEDDDLLDDGDDDWVEDRDWAKLEENMALSKELENHPDFDILVTTLEDSLGIEIERSLRSGKYNGREGHYLRTPDVGTWTENAKEAITRALDKASAKAQDHTFEFAGVSDYELEPGERSWDASIEFFANREESVNEMDINDPVKRGIFKGYEQTKRGVLIPLQKAPKGFTAQETPKASVLVGFEFNKNKLITLTHQDFDIVLIKGMIYALITQKGIARLKVNIEKGNYTLNNVISELKKAAGKLNPGKLDEMDINDVAFTNVPVNESYRKFKKKVTNPRQQMNNSVREIEKHLREVDRIVEYNLKLKTEMDLGGGNFFAGTNKRLARISERINHLNNKLKELGN